uniref:Brevican n=1 Tax=Pundamilia nyererei TaxID=303518 RepID=A0A3B4FTJ4_9CICH
QLYWISGISKALISAKAPPSLAVNDGDCDLRHYKNIVAPLSSSISIPCVVSLSPISNSTSATPVVPRVKWSVISRGVETQILVVRGHKVKVNEAYRDRAALLNYTSFPDDASLWLGDLRSSDSAHYRCEVQQGLEDASDLVELKVKGVVFHYRDALGRYAFTFHQAQRACEAIGARIATADQLLASYYDGYEQCDAGWLADQSVRYPIQVPREACYGDMDGQPGVRNYGTMDPDDLFDVYCYVDEINGEVFHDFIPQQLTFNEAQSYCRAAGAELATTAQLYLAWSEGLDHCSPGWLSDGSVRYPIITPRERCGGALPGVKTLYQFSNQTGFPEPSSLHDVYCFKGDNVVPLNANSNVAPSFEYEEKANTSSTHVYEQANVSTALFTEKEADVSSTLEEDSDFSQTVVLDEDEANIIPIRVFEEEATVAPTLEDETNVSPTSQEKTDASEDFAIFPSSSQTSKWDLLTSTTQPQESRNEYSQKTSTAASSSSRGTKPTKTTTVATTTTTAATTTTTTTHRSRHTWSPTTTTPKMLIPPVGHALEDVDITFTQPPTLLIMPNERAAVGGTGKSSGNVNATFINACLLNPCLNGGTCTDRGGHIKCLCLPTYEGNFCQAGELRCEPGWDKFHGFCYRHFSQRLSWEAAEQHCRMMGAHLVSIITPEEQAYINNNYKEYQWTGLNDKTIENDFHWSDGNPLLYENWYRGQPDSYFLSGEDCVVMVWHDNGRWSDVPCNYHLSYTCKKGTSSCGPPPRVRNASIYGKARQTYETNAVVRYRCAEGFQQRFNPLIRCLSGGFWERPQILCLTDRWPHSLLYNTVVHRGAHGRLTECKQAQIISPPPPCFTVICLSWTLI